MQVSASHTDLIADHPATTSSGSPSKLFGGHGKAAKSLLPFAQHFEVENDLQEGKKDIAKSGLEQEFEPPQTSQKEMRNASVAALVESGKNVLPRTVAEQEEGKTGVVKEKSRGRKTSGTVHARENQKAEKTTADAKPGFAAGAAVMVIPALIQAIDTRRPSQAAKSVISFREGVTSEQQRSSNKNLAYSGWISAGVLSPKNSQSEALTMDGKTSDLSQATGKEAQEKRDVSLPDALTPPGPSSEVHTAPAPGWEPQRAETDTASEPRRTDTAQDTASGKGLLSALAEVAGVERSAAPIDPSMAAKVRTIQKTAPEAGHAPKAAGAPPVSAAAAVTIEPHGQGGQHLSVSAATVSEVHAPTQREASRSMEGNLFQRLDSGEPPPALLHASAREVVVGIRDPSLGWLEIQTQSAGGHLSATLAASSLEAHAALASQAPAITQYLEERNVHVHAIGVGLHANGGDAGGGSRQSFSGHQEERHDPAWAPSSGRREVSAIQSSSSATGEEITTGRISVRA